MTKFLSPVIWLGDFNVPGKMFKTGRDHDTRDSSETPAFADSKQPKKSLILMSSTAKAGMRWEDTWRLPRMETLQKKALSEVRSTHIEVGFLFTSIGKLGGYSCIGDFMLRDIPPKWISTWSYVTNIACSCYPRTSISSTRKQTSQTPTQSMCSQTSRRNFAATMMPDISHTPTLREPEGQASWICRKYLKIWANKKGQLYLRLWSPNIAIWFPLGRLLGKTILLDPWHMLKSLQPLR